eukprot:6033228-Alexandrium_andersonii.AAC.1
MCIRDRHQGADQPLELPRHVLDGAIGPRLVRGRRLEQFAHPTALQPPGADRPARARCRS